jgi:UDP-glucose 4-epimerase
LRELPKRGYRSACSCAAKCHADQLRERADRRPSPPAQYVRALAEVDAGIHTAGVAQTMSGVPEDDYRLLNAEATMKLARAAERVGVRRFVFLSSIRAQSGRRRKAS